MYNRVELVQVVRVNVVESGGLFVATSADIPPMHAAAFDLIALRDAIEDSISRYFYSMDEEVDVHRHGRNPDDLSTWHVVPVHDRYREAAE